MEITTENGWTTYTVGDRQITIDADASPSEVAAAIGLLNRPSRMSAIADQLQTAGFEAEAKSLRGMAG